MRGICHVIVGGATAIIADTTLRAVAIACNNSFYNDLNAALYKPFAAMFPASLSQTSVAIIIYTIDIILFLVGCLLPDCDSEKSIVGRLVHIPVKHRTWTHTIWCIIPLTLMGFAVPCFFFLAYGYFLHILFDSLSKGGICWFYPISQYKTWASGAQVKKNHKFYLYRTGKTSEIILLVCVAVAGTIMSMYAVYLSTKHGGLPFHAEWITDASRA